MTLSRDEIMAMTAEQLRVAIAEKRGIENIHRDREGDWFGVSIHGNHATAFFRDWVTDIAAAWELVEEMRKAGNPVAILFVPDDYERQGVVEVGDYQDEPDQIAFAFADTALLAISRAWLIWSEESGK